MTTDQINKALEKLLQIQMDEDNIKDCNRIRNSEFHPQVKRMLEVNFSLCETHGQFLHMLQHFMQEAVRAGWNLRGQSIDVSELERIHKL